MKLRLIICFVFCQTTSFLAIGQYKEEIDCAKVEEEIEAIKEWLVLQLPDSIHVNTYGRNFFKQTLENSLEIKNKLFLRPIYVAYNINSPKNVRPISTVNLLFSKKIPISMYLGAYEPYSNVKYELWFFINNKTSCNELEKQILIKKVPIYNEEFNDGNKKLTLDLNFFLNGVKQKNTAYKVITDFQKEVKTNQQTKSITFLRKQRNFNVYIEKDGKRVSDYSMHPLDLRNGDELALHRFVFKRKKGYSKPLTQVQTEIFNLINDRQDLLNGQGVKGKWNYLEVYVFKHEGAISKIVYKKYVDDYRDSLIISGGIFFFEGEIIDEYNHIYEP